MFNPYIVIVDHDKELIRATAFVEVLPEATVDELKKKMVKDEELDVGPSRLVVWKCSDQKQKALDGFEALEPEDAHERLQSIFSDEEDIVRVGGKRVVSTMFSDDETLVVEILQKVNLDDDRKRKALDDKEDSRKRLRRLVSTCFLDDEILVVETLKKANTDDGRKRKALDDQDDSRKRLRAAIRKAPPSYLAIAKQFKTISGPDGAIGCNRPFENDAIPITLLDDTFGLFKDRCREPPSTKAMTLLIELASAACEWHSSEDLRELALRSLFEKKADLSFVQQVITIVVEETDSTIECTTDGNLNSRVIMPAAIRGCKNEFGQALNRAILYYSRFLDIALNDYSDRDSRFP